MPESDPSTFQVLAANRQTIFIVGGDEKRRLELARQIFEIHRKVAQSNATLRTPHSTILRLDPTTEVETLRNP
jgi:hypothetical protein